MVGYCCLTFGEINVCCPIEYINELALINFLLVKDIRSNTKLTSPHAVQYKAKVDSTF